MSVCYDYCTLSVVHRATRLIKNYDVRIKQAISWDEVSCLIPLLQRAFGNVSMAMQYLTKYQSEIIQTLAQNAK